MLNVKEWLPDGAAFKFLFHFPEVIRVAYRLDDQLPRFGGIRVPALLCGVEGVVSMKSHEGLVRLKLFQVKEKRRQLGQLDLMMGEFERMAAELDAQILSEEKKAGITDTTHFAYPTFAKAARQRRDNLFDSIRDLKAQKDEAEAALAESEAELAKAEALEQRDGKPRDIDEIPVTDKRAMIG